MQTLSEVNQGLWRLEVYYAGLKLKLLFLPFYGENNLF